MKTASARFNLLRRWRRDVVFRVAVTIMLVVMVGSGLFAAWSIQTLQERAALEVQERAEGMADVLAQALARPLFDINNLAVMSVVEAARADPDLALVQVSAADGTVLARVLPNGTSMQDVALAVRPISLQDGGRRYDLGRLEMALSHEGSRHKLRGQIVQTALANLLFTVLVCAMLLLMARQIRQPFAEVWQAIDKLARGETDFNLSGVARQDQVGRMSKAVMNFRDTLEKLRHAESAGLALLEEKNADIRERQRIERSLEELNDKLEARIAERTRELTDSVVMLAESQQKLQAIVDTALDAVVRIDSSGHIVGWNSQAEATFGFSATRALGQTLHDTVIPPRYRQAHLAGMARFMATGESTVIGKRIEIAALRKDGAEFPIELAITRVSLQDKGKFEFCAFIRDITQRKQAEDEIRISLERQRELNQLKSRFVSMASHEFRTPLATIQSSAELVKLYAQRMPEDERQSLLQAIETAVRRMASMLDDVLLIGKSDADMVEFEPAPLKLRAFCQRLVDETVAGPIDTTRHRIGLAMQGEADDALFDEKLLRHIFGNLLSNAVKYSPEGGEVLFDVACTAEEVRFCVSDQGIGMSDQDRERLFETFFRGANVGVISGTGLGLAIVKRSVDLHGGVIEVHSLLGQGSRFTVSLPRLGVGAT